MKKFTHGLKISLCSVFCVGFLAFSDPETMAKYAGFLQKTLAEHYDSSQENNQIKSYELNVTNNGFCRYKRYFKNGKTEYFAFKLSRFKNMDYLGNASAGKLLLQTKGDDIMVQTYKDKGGDVDSMTTQLMIPLRNIEAEDLNLIREKLEGITKLPVNP